MLLPIWIRSNPLLRVKLVYRLADLLDTHLHHLALSPSPSLPLTFILAHETYDLKSEDILDQHIPKNKTGASHSIVEENLKEKKERQNKSEARKDTGKIGSASCMMRTYCCY